jgi:hypothetical protein
MQGKKTTHPQTCFLSLSVVTNPASTRQASPLIFTYDLSSHTSKKTTVSLSLEFISTIKKNNEQTQPSLCPLSVSLVVSLQNHDGSFSSSISPVSFSSSPSVDVKNLPPYHIAKTQLLRHG